MPRYRPDEVEVAVRRSQEPADLGPLFAPPPSVPVDTSIAAAASVTADSAAWRDRVRLFLHRRATQGATEQEIEDALELGGSTVRPRLRELEGWPFKDGKPSRPVLIRKTTRTRLTRSGRSARVYVCLCCVRELRETESCA